MNKKNILPIITLVSVLLINVSTLLNGIKHHEEYMLVIGSIGCAMILVASVIRIVKVNKEKKRQAL